MMNMAVSILFCVQDIPLSRKFSENDFGKIVSTSYRNGRNGRIFGGRSIAELLGHGNRGGLCWMWKKPIGSDESRVSRVWVLYRDWLYRKKILENFGEGEVGWGCWRYRGPIVMDDSEEWLIWAQYRDWLYPEEIWMKILREKSRKTANLARMWTREIEIDFWGVEIA